MMTIGVLLIACCLLLAMALVIGLPYSTLLDIIMKKIILVACAGMLAGAFFSNKASAADPHWTYSGVGGPNEWVALAPEYSACGGKNQSPVNLTGFIRANLKPIQFSYGVGGDELVNNGHTVQMNFAKGNSIVLDGITFELKQFHFHTPSENHIEGKAYPMEAHLVHADKDGNLAVVAVMIKQGAQNAAIASLWSKMPMAEGDKSATAQPFSAAALLPKARNYHRFNGSLTTPPCTEGVRWVVMKQPISASAEQVAAFANVIHEPNNRPVQALNAREVLQ
jgi:carbonic anhydrase